MPVREAPTPAGVLYRIGRYPDPLEWPEWEYVGEERFDDPQRRYRVLYAAEQRRVCFLETLARFRPSLELLAKLAAVSGTDEPMPTASVPADWHTKRCIGRLRLAPEQRWLDLRATDTHQALRAEFAELLVDFGITDLDVSAIRGPHRALTRAISRWAYDRGYHGLIYRSRFEDRSDCWAIFEKSLFAPVHPAEPITRTDLDLRAVADLFGLAL